MGSSGGSGPAPQAHMSCCMAPTGPRGSRPHSPALLGKALPSLPIHSQAARHTPGEGTGSKFLSSQVAQWLCLCHPLPPSLLPSLTSWKLMHRPSGQEYSGQGTFVPLGPPGAVIPSEGKRKENSKTRTPPPAPTSLGLHQGNRVHTAAQLILALGTVRDPITELLEAQAQLGSQTTGEEATAGGQLGGACGHPESVLLGSCPSHPLSAEGLAGGAKSTGRGGQGEG